MLIADDTRLIKLILHITADEQLRRFRSRGRDRGHDAEDLDPSGALASDPGQRQAARQAGRAAHHGRSSFQMCRGIRVRSIRKCSKQRNRYWESPFQQMVYRPRRIRAPWRKFGASYRVPEGLSPRSSIGKAGIGSIRANREPGEFLVSLPSGRQRLLSAFSMAHCPTGSRRTPRWRSFL